MSEVEQDKGANKRPHSIDSSAQGPETERPATPTDPIHGNYDNLGELEKDDYVWSFTRSPLPGQSMDPRVSKMTREMKDRLTELQRLDAENQKKNAETRQWLDDVRSDSGSTNSPQRVPSFGGRSPAPISVGHSVYTPAATPMGAHGQASRTGQDSPLQQEDAEVAAESSKPQRKKIKTETEE